jgi:hypothetical protein
MVGVGAMLNKVIHEICRDGSIVEKGEEEVYRMIHLQLTIFPTQEIKGVTSDGEFWRTSVLGRCGLGLMLSHTSIEKMDGDELNNVYKELCGCRPIAIQDIRTTIKTMVEKERHSVEECDLFLLYKAIHRYTMVDNGEDIYHTYCDTVCGVCRGALCNDDACKGEYTNIINYL